MWNISPFNGYGPDGRRHYGKGGGGDGGAEEMRRQEEERKRRVRESMNRINEVFGGEIVETVFDPVPDMGDSMSANTLELLYKGQGGIPRQVRSKVPGQFTDDYFTSIADAFLNFQRPLFEEQLREARRRLPLQFGSTASSAYQRTLGELERDAAREEAMLREMALDFANQRRMEVERNRADLTSLANAGTDAAVIAQQAAARADALARTPSFEPIADLFAKYTAVAANRALASPGSNPFQQVRPLNFPTRDRSVRVVG